MTTTKNHNENMRVFLPEDFPLLPLIKSRFVGKGTLSVEEAADYIGADPGTIYKMLNGDKPLYANIEWALIGFVAKKNPGRALDLLQQILETLGLPLDVRYRTNPRVRKSLNAICEQLRIMFDEKGA